MVIKEEDERMTKRKMMCKIRKEMTRNLLLESRRILEGKLTQSVTSPKVTSFRFLSRDSQSYQSNSYQNIAFF